MIDVNGNAHDNTDGVVFITIIVMVMVMVLIVDGVQDCLRPHSGTSRLETSILRSALFEFPIPVDVIVG